MSLSTPFRFSARLLPAALLVGSLCGSAAAQYAFEFEPWYYKGNGLAQEIRLNTNLYSPALAQGDVIHIELGELAASTAQSELDTALLLQDGRVFVNPSTASGDGFDQVGASKDWVAMARLTQEAQDQLVVSDGAGLYRLNWTGSGPGFTETMVHLIDGANELGGEKIHASHPDPLNNKSFLVVLNNNGSECKIVSVNGASATLEFSFTPTTAQGQFYDACLVNITSDHQRAEQVAVITDRGLEILELDGTAAVIPGVPAVFAGAPEKAFLSVLPAELSAANRDYLLWHVSAPSVDEVVFTIHDGHFAIMHAAGMGLKQLIVANFLNRTGPTVGDLVLSRADSTGWVNLAGNSATTDPGQPAFILNLSSTEPALIDMNRLQDPTTGPVSKTIAPLVAAGDLNFDGHDDLVMLDEGNRLCIFLGGQIGELDPAAPSPQDSVNAGLVVDPGFPDEWQLSIDFRQSNAAFVDYFIWYRPTTEPSDPTTSFGELPVYAGTVTSSTSTPIALPVEDIGGIFMLSIHPYAADGSPLQARGFRHSGSQDGIDELNSVSVTTFPWLRTCPFNDPYSPGCGGTGTVPLPHPRTSPRECNGCRIGQTCTDPRQGEGNNSGGGSGT